MNHRQWKRLRHQVRMAFRRNRKLTKQFSAHCDLLLSRFGVSTKAILSGDVRSAGSIDEVLKAKR